MSKPFGLLGEKLRHSYSPLIHSLLADYEYRLFEVPPDSLADFLGERGFAGLNVTIPYKTAVIPFCDSLSDIAQRTESVNTILIKNGSLIGENTDYYGFLYLIKKAVKIKRQKSMRPRQRRIIENRMHRPARSWRRRNGYYLAQR